MTSSQDCLVGLPRNYLRPCLLLLLAEGTAHGYELHEQIAELGLNHVDPGGLYRCLRAMDEEGLLRSAWEPSSYGPARRTYTLTAEGLVSLHAVAGPIHEVSLALDRYQSRYQRALRQRVDGTTQASG